MLGISVLARVGSTPPMEDFGSCARTRATERLRARQRSRGTLSRLMSRKVDGMGFQELHRRPREPSNSSRTSGPRPRHFSIFSPKLPGSRGSTVRYAKFCDFQEFFVAEISGVRGFCQLGGCLFARKESIFAKRPPTGIG